MFTGLIEEIGILRGVSSGGEMMVLTIGASLIMSDLKIGDSVAVNGVCLTATSISEHSFTVDVMPQTYRNSNLRELRSGSRMNLERAMAAGGRFGGHIVQGHVDGTGEIRSVKRDQNAVVFEITPDKGSLFKYIIPKGSITLDGISLTVVSTSSSAFTVSIIPHTLGETVLNHKRPGDSINIECDVLGKYVDHLLHYRGAGSEEEESSSRISRDFLAANGFV
ncbi:MULTISPECIES: riboflavin synthase [unclassified Paenibacillus]|uniref:riboflavin synthase n=1 Tax=unclassified Paenibacillus TaxID=185978 RepID=UPI0024060598|nr:MULTISPECIES: riboflavin synthase [unclassified Paenibacillus]MDF9840382.1 riboflavin synthase [Paenibacillus sp. PastF-2]MDF9846964.1 riboflavin synthase [Paenibacillus sp. PastM-2]MDF9853536.1 riboflavin synthase [Paenibacillus sp. PastF-1]MDH6478978.1 riboflavin synthase [Paenibacillus sp. PastH-2]MDH6506710.1 riboflavin synthase [Paenibacillus sp. PastM-3]